MATSKKGASFKQTFHAEIKQVSCSGKEIIVKQIGRRYPNFSPNEALILESQLLDYYHRLALAGVPVPRIFNCEADKDIVINTMPYMGSTVAELIKFSAKEDACLELIKSALSIIGCLLKAPDNRRSVDDDELQLSIEPSPDNFAVNSEGQVVLIDFTPPLNKAFRGLPPERMIPTTQLDEDPKWKEFRYFDKRGVILTFLIKFAARWPSGMSKICSMVADFLKKHSEESISIYLRDCLASVIAELVEDARESVQRGDHKVAARIEGQITNLVMQASPASRDQLRLVAILLTPTNPEILWPTLFTSGVKAPVEKKSDALLQYVFTEYKSPSMHSGLQLLLLKMVKVAIWDSELMENTHWPNLKSLSLF